MWELTEDCLESISIGAGILGTGGGGNPYLGWLRSRQILRKYGPVTVKTPEELDENDLVVSVAGVGAPTVGVEKIRGVDCYKALRALESYTGKNATALISAEIGGSNSLEPVIAAGLAGLPVVDADGMGRAFPELQMTTFFIYGVPCVPAVLCDEKGNTVIFTEAVSPIWLERIGRAITVQMGCVSVSADCMMSADEVRRTAIPHTLSLARSLGDAVREARRSNSDPVQAILGACPGKVLFQGKIVDVERRTTAGFARGKVTIQAPEAEGGESLVIDFQNENLIARSNGSILCTVPDLICIVDTERGEPITTELLRYGFRVTVLVFPAPELLKTPQALEVVGPKAFGYDCEYIPTVLN